MNWMQALAYCSKLKGDHKPIYDCNGQPHWIELDFLGKESYVPTLCSESEYPFSPNLQPYCKKRKV